MSDPKTLGMWCPVSTKVLRTQKNLFVHVPRSGGRPPEKGPWGGSSVEIHTNYFFGKYFPTKLHCTDLTPSTEAGGYMREVE
jgi:hypothetical protein